MALLHPGIGEGTAQAELAFDRAVSEFGLSGQERLYDNSVIGADEAALRGALDVRGRS